MKNFEIHLMLDEFEEEGWERVKPTDIWDGLLSADCGTYSLYDCRSNKNILFNETYEVIDSYLQKIAANEEIDVSCWLLYSDGSKVRI